MSIEVKPGWQKSKRTSLEGDFPEFSYLHGNTDFRVVADHRGVRMKGISPFLVGPGDYDSFAWILADAAREQLKFKRNKLTVVGDNEIEEITKRL